MQNRQENNPNAGPKKRGRMATNLAPARRNGAQAESDFGQSTLKAGQKARKLPG